MADVVQIRLELHLDEYADLEKRGLFTRAEIAQIVKQRRKFEYRVNRHSKIKQDFLNFIEYEKQLDTLRRLRKRAISRNLKEIKGVADYAGVTTILKLYETATMRFKGDLGLWFQYLEYCKEKKHGRIKKVLRQVTQFHPKVPAVWMYVAAWNFDQNLNVTAARAMMQNGLRQCPTSEDLWVEYLRMELTYLNKLKARKVLLGEDDGKMVHEPKDSDKQQWKEENKDLFMSLNEECKNGEGSDGQEKDPTEPDVFQEQGSMILQTIYSGAIEALPHNLSLRQRFLEILEGTILAQSEEMKNKVLDDMKREFSTDPEYWDWLAKHTMSSQRLISKAIEVYEEALTRMPSAAIFHLYTNFLLDTIAKKVEKQSSVPPGENIDLTAHLFRVFEKAEIMGCLTEDLACQHVSLYLQLGRLDEARKLAENLCNGKLADATKLWVLWGSIELKYITMKSVPLSKAELSGVLELLRKVLSKASISAAESLWLMALKFFANQKRYFDKLVEISLISLFREGGSETGFSLSSVIVNFVLQRDGMQEARKMYTRYLSLPHPGIVIYRTCIELEVNLASGGNKDCLSNARKMFESALIIYDQDEKSWRDYHSMEIKMGTPQTSNAIYWRARRTLKDGTDFTVNPSM